MISLCMLILYQYACDARSDRETESPQVLLPASLAHAVAVSAAVVRPCAPHSSATNDFDFGRKIPTTRLSSQSLSAIRSLWIFLLLL